MAQQRQTHASFNDRIAISVVRWLFVIGSVTLLIAALFRGQWEARLRTADAVTFISHLPNSPVWQPPTVPAYQHFTDVFDRLPREQPDSSAISLVARWDWMAIEFLLWFWLFTSSIGMLYKMTRGTHFDLLLHFVLYIALGLTITAGICIGVWLTLGGWGPPAPLFFGICGILLGIGLGVKRLRQLKVVSSETLNPATEPMDEREPE